MALGLAWLREYTHELLPWLELLPKAQYLPLLWNNRTKRDKYELYNTQAARTLDTLETEFTTVEPYLDMLNLTSKQV